MRLNSSGSSPFGRKVKVAARELGLIDRIEVIPQQLTPVSPNPAVCADNPLGKIPCLVTDEGAALYDSRVICEYLDHLAGGGRIFPASDSTRFAVLTRQALGDGILDAAVGARYEQVLRPEEYRWENWTQNQMLKVMRSLDHLEADRNLAPDVDIGAITIGCALGYLDFRYPDIAWRRSRERLALWYDGLAARPSMTATIPG